MCIRDRFRNCRWRARRSSSRNWVQGRQQCWNLSSQAICWICWWSVNSLFCILIKVQIILIWHWVCVCVACVHVCTYIWPLSCHYDHGPELNPACHWVGLDCWKRCEGVALKELLLAIPLMPIAYTMYSWPIQSMLLALKIKWASCYTSAWTN